MSKLLIMLHCRKRELLCMLLTTGIHGEPGIKKGPMQSADALADVMIEAILAPSRNVASKGDSVAVLINNLGSKCCNCTYTCIHSIHWCSCTKTLALTSVSSW
jgi:dihydroxyacetone kinase